MVRRIRPNLTLLALLTAAGLLSAGEGLRPLSRDVLAAIRSQQAMRADQIARDLEASRCALGLGMLDGLQAYNQITDAYGETHVRFHQTYRGVEVYRGVAVGHMDASGHLETPHAALQTGIDLAPATLLSENAIQERVARMLSSEGRLWPMEIKQLVFPTRFQDGVKLKRDAQGAFVIDRAHSVTTRQKAEPYRWAFLVSTMQATKHGPEATEFIIDGVTGEVLKKWDGMQHAAPVGKGLSQYSGTVALNTQQLDNGMYTLRDTTRATQPHPKASQIPDWGGVGIQTICYDTQNATNSIGTVAFTNTTNTWGDGTPFVWDTDWPGTMYTSHGQTAAVDAHYNIQCTWDYYANVLGRTGGIDGQGSSPISIVHMTDDYGGILDNAAWNPSFFVMLYGDGEPTGSLTCLDVAAHEMSHGVMSYTADLYGGEASGLNEANSDIHATMVKYYYWGANGQGNAVPDATTLAPGGNNTDAYLWTTGAQLSKDGLTPMRWLYKPSKDGFSYDAWFDGVAIDDSHFSMGPGIRAFYFLSRGASATAGQDTYSAYLPAGMKGIGNDKAIHIWYHGMCKYVTDPGSDYHAIRVAMLASAAELYPASGSSDSPEVAAVKNAFAAINVGAAEGGQEPVKVSFPSLANSPFTDDKITVAPALVPVNLPVPTVSNATDTSVTYSLGGLSAAVAQGGKIVNGQFIAPVMANGGIWPIKATSKQDPKEFAVDGIFAASMDCDCDTDTDACDMGAMALAYGGVNVYPAANLYGGFLGADDICVWLFLEGFNNAFNN